MISTSYRILGILLCIEVEVSMSSIIIDTDFASMVDPVSIALKETTNGLPLAFVRTPGPDLDIGPWCKFNKTSGQLVNGPETIWPVYNYTKPNSTCGADATCSLAGCVMYRETYYKSGIQAWEGCSVVFPWWYASGPAGNRTSQPCPQFDNLTSTFTFKGKEFYNLMFNYGHTYGATDCQSNILCSTSGIWFDSTQHTSLKWCQQTPVGWYSPQCNNSKYMCDSGGIDMTTKYYATHGMGSSLGCGIRRTAPAFLQSGAGLIPLSESRFSISADVSLMSTPAASTTSAGSVLFGLLSAYYMGIFSTGLSSQFKLIFFHRDLTVTPQSSVIGSSESFTMESSTTTNLAVQCDGSYVTFWVNRGLIGNQIPISWSTASIGTLNLTGLPAMYTDGSMLHVGFFSVGRSGDWINPTTAQNPYSAELFADLKISNIKVESGIKFTTSTTTTTSAPVSSTTSTVPVVVALSTSTTVSMTTTAAASITTAPVPSTTTVPVTTTTSVTSTTVTSTTTTPVSTTTTGPSTTTLTSTTTPVSTSTAVASAQPVTTTTSVSSTTISSTTSPSASTTSTTIPDITSISSTVLVVSSSSTPTTDARMSTTTTQPTSSSTTPAPTTTTTRTESATSTPTTRITSTDATITLTTTQPPTTAADKPSTIPPETTASYSLMDTLDTTTSNPTVVSESRITSMTSTDSPITETTISQSIGYGRATEDPRTFVNGSSANTANAEREIAAQESSLLLIVSCCVGGVVLLALLLTCACRYKFDGALNLVRRGSRSVERIVHSSFSE